jgi:transposase
MYIRTKTTPNSPRRSVQIVESIRDGEKVRQKIVRHVGTALDDDELKRMIELAEHIKAKLETEAAQLNLFSPEELAKIAIKARQRNDNKPLHVDLKELVEEQRVVIGIHEIFGKLYHELGFSSTFTNPARHKLASNLLEHIVMARIANPKSKRGSVMMLERDFGVSLPLHKVYRMLDAVDDTTIGRIQDIAYRSTMDLLQQKINVLLYDCTTLYFESFSEDEFKQNGYSKDLKFNQPQVLLALVVTEEGLPLSYDLFPGACFEGHTLVPMLKKLREKYDLQHVIFVGDRGMLSETNLSALEDEGFQYIVGARLRNLPKQLTTEILRQEHYTLCGENQHIQKIAEFPQKNNRRLLVSYSEKRAGKDKSDREKAIDALTKKLAKSKNPKILLSSYGYKKYLKIVGESTLQIQKDKLAEESQWDGLYGVTTNVQEKSADAILDHYRGLWQIEECFRVSKHDLKIRPIFHWTPARVKAHVAIAFMALVCVRHLEYRVALQYEKLSPEVIRNELLHVQLSYLIQKKTKTRYGLPSKVSQHAKKIYQVMGLKLTTVPFQIS